MCAAPMHFFGRATVLLKHEAEYERCSNCGLVVAADPYWLSEAYEQAISTRDLGMLTRSLDNADTVEALILLGLDPGARFLDFAGGYGVFTRLMRDRGLDFRHTDPFCQNLFATRFEAAADDAEFALVTAFEVLEHFSSPGHDFAALAARGRVLFATTQLLPEPAPALGEWWYHDLVSGQHIAFYTERSLAHMASQHGLRLVTDGVSRHLFLPASSTLSDRRVRLAYGFRSRLVVKRLLRHRKTARTLLPLDAADLLQP